MNSKSRPPGRTLKPDSGPPLVAVARLEGLFGVRGELKCRPSSAGESMIEPGRRFALDDRGRQQATIAGVRRHQGRFVVTLEGVTDATAAQAFVGSQLFAQRVDVPLAAGEYLDGDLEGLRIVDESGTELGTVARVEHYPASDCLVVLPQNALVPLVSEFILNVDVPARSITVRLPAGLLDGNEAVEA
jgi:16S rRNA processing protein RimM